MTTEADEGLNRPAYRGNGRSWEDYGNLPRECQAAVVSEMDRAGLTHNADAARSQSVGQKRRVKATGRRRLEVQHECRGPADGLPQSHYVYFRVVADAEDMFFVERILTSHPSVVEHTEIEPPDVRDYYEREPSRADLAAQNLGRAMGSWAFIVGFLAFLGLWAAVQTLVLRTQAFDKYPFLLVNLLLTIIASLQGSILLIANKRREQRSDQAITDTHSVVVAIRNRITAMEDRIRQNRIGPDI